MADADNERPFVSPCQKLAWSASIRWIRLGWQDFKAAGRASLGYGLLIVAISWLVSVCAYVFGNLGVLLALLTGFVLLGPLLALALYALSAQLETGVRPSIRASLRLAIRSAGSAMVFTIVLLIIFLVWARAASMVHVFFPSGGISGVEGMWLFLGVGSAVGAVFSGIVFTASAFSLPMLLDRETDAITAVVTSVNAVLRNKPAMLVWAALIVLFTLAGFLTLFLGLAVIMPVIGHASWHAYRETIDGRQWPRRNFS